MLKIFTIYCIIFFCLIAYVYYYFILAIVRNFIFLPCVVVWNSLSLSSEKSKTPFEQNIQYQAVLSSFSILYVWIFISLHFMCTHSWHLPHCTALWFFPTGFLQILQGYFIGISKSSYSYSNFDVFLLL